jgi:SAM-dependent methyltransferase
MAEKIWELNSKESLDKFYNQAEDPWGTRSISEKVIRYRELEQIIPNVPMGMALDIACGEGDLLAKISHGVKKAVGIDISLVALKRASRKFPYLAFFNADVKTLTSDFFSQFDLIIWLDAITWISHREGIEILRTLSEAAKLHPMYLILSSRITPLPGTTDIDHWPMHDFATPAEFIAFSREVFPAAKPIPVQLNMNIQYPWTLPYLRRLSRLFLKGLIKILGYSSCLKLAQIAFQQRPLYCFIEPFIVHLAMVVAPDSNHGRKGGLCRP